MGIHLWTPPRLLGIAGHLPAHKQESQNKDYEGEQASTNDFMDFPSDLFDPSLAAFVETNHSRHVCLQMMAEGCGTVPRGAPGHPLRIGFSFRFGVSL
jgi:hypothetical protein